MLHVFQSLHVVVNNNLRSIGFSDLTNRIYKFGFAYNMYLWDIHTRGRLG